LEREDFKEVVSKPWSSVCGNFDAMVVW
jgi:hypothetical protein